MLAPTTAPSLAPASMQPLATSLQAYRDLRHLGNSVLQRGERWFSTFLKEA
jgi:hypothetical protein